MIQSYFIDKKRDSRNAEETLMVTIGLQLFMGEFEPVLRLIILVATRCWFWQRHRRRRRRYRHVRWSHYNGIISQSHVATSWSEVPRELLLVELLPLIELRWNLVKLRLTLVSLSAVVIVLVRVELRRPVLVGELHSTEHVPKEWEFVGEHGPQAGTSDLVASLAVVPLVPEESL